MKHLLAMLTLWSFFGLISPILAAKPLNFYLPKDKVCAVYQGRVDDIQGFPVWIEKGRKLKVKVNNEVRVAVIFQTQVIAPYQIDSLENNTTAQYIYRTSETGNHLISIQGASQDTKITFCLD